MDKEIRKPKAKEIDRLQSEEDRTGIRSKEIETIHYSWTPETISKVLGKAFDPEYSKTKHDWTVIWKGSGYSLYDYKGDRWHLQGIGPFANVGMFRDWLISKLKTASGQS